MDANDFLALPRDVSRDKAETVLPLTTRRKRHRRSNKIRTEQEKEYQLHIQASVDDNGQELIVGPARKKELVFIAIGSMYGEIESKRRFRYELVGYDKQNNFAIVRLKTPDYVSFAGALALLPVEEGRLRILECKNVELKAIHLNLVL